MGLNLRAEGAKFILAAFNLDVAGESRGSLPASLPASLPKNAAGHLFAVRFARFLASEPDAHFALDHRRFISLRVPKSLTDVSLCAYGQDGELLSIVPVFDAREPVAAGAPETEQAIRDVIQAFNRTRTMPEFTRPQTLSRAVSRTRLAAARRIGSRILASTAVSFEQEPVPPDARFFPPDFRLHRGFGTGFMAVRCRHSADGRGVDVWVQFHHAGLDGRPAQEMLDRLESCWGVTAPTVLPADDANISRTISRTPTICNVAGERYTGLLTDYVDFSPLVQLRRELAAQLKPQLEAVPLSGLLLWCLSHQPEFAGVGINTAVDVPPEGDQSRAVDLVAIWPQRYHSRPDGFVAFLRDLLRLFDEARLRKSVTWNSLEQLAAAPAIVSWAILRFLPQVTRSKFGTLTVSLIKGVKAIAAPIPDAAWDHGFIVIGNVGMASASGPPVTPVSIKGDPARIRSYPAAIRRAIAESRRYVGRYAE